MKILCVVTCGRKKIWEKYPNLGPVKARKAYIGNFSKKCNEYAESFYQENWRILSAKYGLLNSERYITNYDVTFNDPKTNPIGFLDIQLQLNTNEYRSANTIIVVAGKKYVEMMKLAAPNVPIIAPLEGCQGNGYMMQKMNNAISCNEIISV